MTHDIERLAWATDPHLNFAASIRDFCDRIRSLDPDGLVITGDISEAPTLREHLRELDDLLRLPTWIVLGNHDFYHGSIAPTRQSTALCCQKSKWLHYLPETSPVHLNADTALVGHEGWADGRLGDYQGSSVVLNDYIRISDLAGLEHRTARLAKLHDLGDEAAAFLRPRLVQAMARRKNVIVATHVPPFEAACWHEGRISGKDYLPHFACKAVGDLLIGLAERHPENSLLVLCGHTHSAGIVQIAPNLTVRTGDAIYGQPRPGGVVTTRSLRVTSVP